MKDHRKNDQFADLKTGENTFAGKETQSPCNMDKEKEPRWSKIYLRLISSKNENVYARRAPIHIHPNTQAGRKGPGPSLALRYKKKKLPMKRKTPMITAGFIARVNI